MKIALVFAIGMTLGPGGNWLIGIPLASIAIERLSLRWSWFVYLGILGTVVLPILYYSTLETALMNLLFISPAILFVALVTQIRMNKQNTRENAERLTRDLEAANRRLAESAGKVIASNPSVWAGILKNCRTFSPMSNSRNARGIAGLCFQLAIPSRGFPAIS